MRAIPSASLFWFAAVSWRHLYRRSRSIPTRRSKATSRFSRLLGAFTGIILFFIFAFSNPFKEPGALSPDGYRHLIAQFDQERRTPTP